MKRLLIFTSLVAVVVSAAVVGAIVLTQDASGGEISQLVPPEPDTDVEIAEQVADRALHDAGVAFITCPSADGGSCTEIKQRKVASAVADGQAVFGRGVHAGITEEMINDEVPVLSAGDLTCDGLECSPASATNVAISETALDKQAVVVYTPLVILDDGSLVAPTPVTPLDQSFAG